jgi:hypothetical protein
VKILVIYFKLNIKKTRNTINEHLYSFRKYNDDTKFHYFNAINGIPRYLTFVKYDGVILHYTFLATRWSRNFFRGWSRSILRLKEIQGYKVAIPQDEYAETGILCQLFREYGVKTVFTMFWKEDYEKAYPSTKVSLDHIVTVFPGYVDEIKAEEVRNHYFTGGQRTIDLGYRARKLPYWLGRQGQLKQEVGEVFRHRTKGSGLRIDISTDDNDVFWGDEWYRFLCRCKAVLGCEGGASLLDATGEIREKVERYLQESPDATFEEVEKNCFPGLDYSIHFPSLSPRFFECAISETCQVLLEGEYGGIFLPGVHYVQVKKDYSNIDEVIELIRNEEYCTRIAANTYRDIVESGKYTYRVFVNEVIAHISEQVDKGGKETAIEKKYFYVLGRYLSFREWFEPVLVKLFYAWLGIKLHRTKVFKELWNKMKGRRG